MPDIFDEVEEDLRADRARALGRRYAGAVIALAVLILVGTGLYVVWQQHRTQQREAVANRFIEAARQADRAASAIGGAKPDAGTQAAASTLAGIAADGPAGYRVLARLRLAALQWQAGQHAQAAATWQSVADDTGAPALFRDLATLTAAQREADSGDPVLLKQRLQGLTAPDNPWRPMAEQVIALVDLRTGRTREAAAILRGLTNDPGAAEGLRSMASDLLATLPADAVAPPPAKQAVTAPAVGAKPHG